MDRRTFIKGLAAALLAPGIAVEVLGAPKVPVSIVKAMSQLEQYEFAEFQAALMRSMAQSMGLPYELLTREYDNTPYSAAKTALIDMKKELNRKA